MHVSECCVSECVCVFCAWVGGGVSERVDFWIISFHQLHRVPIYACQRVLCECVFFFLGGGGVSERVVFCIITFHQLHGVPVCMLVSAV